MGQWASYWRTRVRGGASADIPTDRHGLAIGSLSNLAARWSEIGALLDEALELPREQRLPGSRRSAAGTRHCAAQWGDASLLERTQRDIAGR